MEEKKSGLVDLSGNPLFSKRNNQVPLNQRTRGFKALGKNELAKRITKATELLDQWMQGVIELGARLLMVKPDDEFFDAQKKSDGNDNSTLQMIHTRCQERIIQSKIETITYTFEDDREDVIVYVGDERRKLIEQMKKQRKEKESNGDGTGSDTGRGPC